MTATALRSRLQLAADPNVIPFIDVLLVLLIIFMVTAPKPTTDLRVDLPRPGPSVAAAIPPTIVQIRAAPNGYTVFVGDEAATLQSVGDAALAHMLAAEPALTPEEAYAEGRVFVRADLDVSYESVVAVVEALQDARFRKVSIYAQRADE